MSMRFFPVFLFGPGISSLVPDQATDLYIAKLKLYRPNRVFADTEKIAAEAHSLIVLYNQNVASGKLAEDPDIYMLNIYAILCGYATDKWDYEDTKVCTEIKDIGTAQNYLASLLTKAHMQN